MSQFRKIKLLWSDREKLLFLVLSRMKAYGSDRALGLLWWFIDPLLIIFTYKIIMVDILNRGNEHYPLFLACAVIPWRWFTVSTGAAGTSLVGHAALMKSTGLPRLLVPISEILMASINFVYSIPVLAVFMFAYGIAPSIYLLYFPAIMLIQLIYILSLGILLSLLQVFFRDINNAWSFIVRLWFYLSPALFSIDQVPEKIKIYLMLNPFCFIIESYRNIILYGKAPFFLELFWIATAIGLQPSH